MVGSAAWLRVPAVLCARRYKVVRLGAILLCTTITVHLSLHPTSAALLLTAMHAASSMQLRCYCCVAVHLTCWSLSSVCLLQAVSDSCCSLLPAAGYVWPLRA
jgi:hypothetical protein